MLFGEGKAELQPPFYRHHYVGGHILVSGIGYLPRATTWKLSYLWAELYDTELIDCWL